MTNAVSELSRSMLDFGANVIFALVAVFATLVIVSTVRAFLGGR